MESLPSKYEMFLNTQLETIEIILKESKLGIEPARLHKEAIKYMLKDNPSQAMQLLEKAFPLYDSIDINECSSFLLKCKGDHLLDIIIISTIHEIKCSIESVKNIEITAFVYLWIAFEISHCTLFSCLTSISELFLMPVTGMMIMLAGFLPMTTYLPEYFSIVCHYWQNVYAAQSLRSLGSNQTRYIVKLKTNLSSADETKKKIYQKEIVFADKRIEELTKLTGERYNHTANYDQMLQAITGPISKEEKFSYVDLFGQILRNLRRGSASQEYMFKMLPITKNEAIQNDNAHALFTLIYTDMHREPNKKTNKDVSKELFELSEQLFNEGKYGLASVIVEEALHFNEEDPNIKDFMDLNFKHLLQLETGIVSPIEDENMFYDEDDLDYDDGDDEDDLPF